MSKPILIVMAAGLGSRYGGLKQMEPIGNNGEWIIDYSLYDAWQAGFEKVIFIVREENLQDFKDTIGKRVSHKLQVEYAVQKLEDIPEGFTVPENRQRPWGTGHAAYSARHLVDGSPVMIINADDYYGKDGFKAIYNHLSSNTGKDAYAMVGYHLINTVSKHGHVSRGICYVDDQGYLAEITERTNIRVFDEGIKYSEDNGKSWINLSDDTIVSLNCWGFSGEVFSEMEALFKEFFENQVSVNPTKAEFYLPDVAESILTSGKGRFKILTSTEEWYGVTYQEDTTRVANALDAKKAQGEYPQDLWK